MLIWLPEKMMRRVKWKEVRGKPLDEILIVRVIDGQGHMVAWNMAAMFKVDYFFTDGKAIIAKVGPGKPVEKFRLGPESIQISFRGEQEPSLIFPTPVFVKK
jgi:hypothetical protein